MTKLLLIGLATSPVAIAQLFLLLRAYESACELANAVEGLEQESDTK